MKIIGKHEFIEYLYENINTHEKRKTNLSKFYNIQEIVE